MDSRDEFLASTPRFQAPAHSGNRRRTFGADRVRWARTSGCGPTYHSPAGSPRRPREGPILMGRATNRSARFTGGKVSRQGFWRHWRVWGDRSSRSVIRSGLPEKPRPALRPPPAPAPPRRGGGSRRPDHHHPHRPPRRPGLGPAAGPGADPDADLHLPFRFQTFRGSVHLLVQEDAENPPAPADSSGTCRLWSCLDPALRVENGRLAEP